MRVLWEQICEKAKLWPGPVPVVIQNHSKYITDLEPIRLFCDFITQQGYVEVVTGSECVKRIREGAYFINHDNNHAFGNEVYKEALTARLKKIDATAENSEVQASNSQAEEALRILMVKFFPKLSRKETIKKSSDIKILLLKTKTRAKSRDERFIDCWHNFYERIIAHPKMDEFRIWFLPHYKDLLIRKIEQL